MSMSASRQNLKMSTREPIFFRTQNAIFSASNEGFGTCGDAIVVTLLLVDNLDAIGSCKRAQALEVVPYLLSESVHFVEAQQVQKIQ